MTRPLNMDERKALRRKARWRVADLAAYAGCTHKVALGMLRRYDAALGGALLEPSAGTCRVYTFLWRPLAKHAPGLFLDDPVDRQERDDALEDTVEGLRVAQRLHAFQLGENTREIARLKTRARRAA